MNCNFCGSKLVLSDVKQDLEQYTHNGDCEKIYECNKCDSKVIQYFSGNYRSNTVTNERLIRMQEVVPSDYMTVVNHENRIVFSGDKNEDELRRAIQQCKSSCPPSSRWYIIEGRKKYDVWEDELKSNVDSVASKRIKSD